MYEASRTLLQHELYAILEEYVANGGTVFLSSHNLDEVGRICRNVGVLRDGEIVASKSLEDIRALKAHMVTVRFVHAVDPKAFTSLGAEVVSQADGQLVLRVPGDLNPVIAQLHKHAISDLEIARASLEDVFMDYYKVAP